MRLPHDHIDNRISTQIVVQCEGHSLPAYPVVAQSEFEGGSVLLEQLDPVLGQLEKDIAVVVEIGGVHHNPVGCIK